MAFVQDRCRWVGGGAKAECMSWAGSQENTMFPGALAAALWGWLPPKPRPLQPPCPTFPGRLAPPPSSALTSPLSPAPSSPLTAAEPGCLGDCGRQPGPWGRAGAAGVLKPFVPVSGSYGGGRAVAGWVGGGVTPESLRAVEGAGERERGHAQGEGQESRVIFRKRKLRARTPVSCLLCFPASVFLG